MQSDIQSQMSQSQMSQSQMSQSQMPGSQAPHTSNPKPGTMKAAVYKENGIITLEHRPVPALADPQDAIFFVDRGFHCPGLGIAGMGRLRPGHLGLGHEFVGIVEQTGEAVKKFKQGDRVAVNVETFCGECYFCRRGYVNNCTHEHGGWALGCRIDGGQAEYVRVPFADNGLTEIPDEVTDEAALFTGDILSTGYWGASLAEIKPADTVAVIGAGPTGLCTLMCARLYGPGVVIAIDTSDERLKLAKEQGLADVIINPLKQDVEQEIKKLTLGRGADAVLEVAGGRDTFRMAWKIARPNAVVCVVALYEEPQMIPLPDMYGKNLVFKTGGVDASCCEEIMKLIKAGKLDTSCLITHRTKLEHIMEAYDVFENKKDHVIKYAIEVS